MSIRSLWRNLNKHRKPSCKARPKTTCMKRIVVCLRRSLCKSKADVFTYYLDMISCSIPFILSLRTKHLTSFTKDIRTKFHETSKMFCSVNTEHQGSEKYVKYTGTHIKLTHRDRCMYRVCPIYAFTTHTATVKASNLEQWGNWNNPNPCPSSYGTVMSILMFPEQCLIGWIT